MILSIKQRVILLRSLACNSQYFSLEIELILSKESKTIYDYTALFSILPIILSTYTIM